MGIGLFGFEICITDARPTFNNITRHKSNAVELSITLVYTGPVRTKVFFFCPKRPVTKLQYIILQKYIKMWTKNARYKHDIFSIHYLKYNSFVQLPFNR